MPQQNWTRKELLLAFNLYCKLPFGQFHNRNPDVIKVAELIGRSANAVAMKLSNFASLDPYHIERGVRGLSNVSQADKDIWNEFHQDWNSLAAESEIILERFTAQYAPQEITDTPEPPTYRGATETERVIAVRLGQRFFRATILANYHEKCCVCNIPIRSLLIASHIIPWGKREDLRMNPQNGLCLCALHDKAFDAGLLGIDASYKVLISQEINKYMPHEALENGFENYRGNTIALPDKFRPEKEFLDYHLQMFFREN